MSNETGTGRGGWSEERPPSASVRSLFADEAEGASATATEEWYETERLTGQITGGARSSRATERSASQDEAPLALGWRHDDTPPSPTALQRLGRRLERRHRRPPDDTSASAHGEVQAPAPEHEVRRSAVISPSAERPAAAAPQNHRLGADQLQAMEPSGPRLALRGGDAVAQRTPWRWLEGARRWVIASAVMLSIAAAVILGITSRLGTTATMRHQAAVPPIVPAIAPGHQLAVHSAHSASRLSRELPKPKHRRLRRHRHPAAPKARPQGRAQQATPVRSRIVRSSPSATNIPAPQTPTYTHTPAVASARSSATRTSATSSSRPAGPTGSDPLGGIGSCVKGCS